MTKMNAVQRSKQEKDSLRNFFPYLSPHSPSHAFYFFNIQLFTYENGGIEYEGEGWQFQSVGQR